MRHGVLGRVVLGACLGLVVVPPVAQGVSRLDRCFAEKPAARWKLPKRYREVSGLAITDDGRLFFHNDEIGAVGVIDLGSGRLTGNFLLGPPLPRDDFEGIAVLGSRLFLISSFGRLYETRMPAATDTAGTLAFQVTDTKLGSSCEIEGLASNPATDELYVGCKVPRVKALKGTVTIFRWAASKRTLGSPDRVTVSLRALATGPAGRAFRPSGIEWDPRSGHFLLVAAKDYAVAEVDSTGRVLLVRSLRGKHPQAEGIALSPRGELVISDEGVAGPGTISVYGCR